MIYKFYHYLNDIIYVFCLTKDKFENICSTLCILIDQICIIQSTNKVLKFKSSKVSKIYDNENFLMRKYTTHYC